MVNKLEDCMGIRSIVCKNSQELIDLSNLFYNITNKVANLHRIDSNKKDIEIMFLGTKDGWSWQDGHGGTYFKSNYKSKLPSITFQELINTELTIPIW